MCRLYAFRANEPTRVECSLVHAQNALMEQSRGDWVGEVHGHGWGVADYANGAPMIEKKVWAAYHGEHFQKKAARVYAKTVIAHVRKATVGEPSLENTHPFGNGPWIFAHNGTLPHFALVRERMLPNIDPFYRNEIHGTTDSEHIFLYLLSRWRRQPDIDLMDLVGEELQTIVEWCREIDPAAPIGLNVVLTDGKRLVGSRLGRTLWYVERHQIYDCDICGRPHVHHETGQDYRSIEVASEPITDEPWQEVPENTVYAIDEDFYLLSKPIGMPA